MENISGLYDLISIGTLTWPGSINVFGILINKWIQLTLTDEMARRKANLHTHSNSVTLEGASTQHVDHETNQEMHEASTQDEMARRKANLHTHSNSVTLEGASTQHVDHETNQEMHEASTQDMQPPICATHGPSKYLDVWDLPDN
nr:hypothetical protein CFP56_62258 [Quercus suber]